MKIESLDAGDLRRLAPLWLELHAHHQRSRRSRLPTSAMRPRRRPVVYVPPVLDALGLAEVQHQPRNNRMDAL